MLRHPLRTPGDPVTPPGDEIAAAEGSAQVLDGNGGYRRLLANRNFRNLWIGQTISGVGDWLVVGLLIPLVGELAPGSSMAVAGIMIAKIVPSLLIGSVLGVLVDRFDRRRLMIACDLINGVLCLFLLASSIKGVVPAGVALALIYFITFLMEICNLLFVPAKNAIIPSIVEERDLASANGLSYTTQQASMLVGLVASGAIVAVFAAFLRVIIAARIPLFSAFVASAPALLGPQGGIVLDFFSFLLSAALIATLRVKRFERRERALDLRLMGRDVIESWRILRSHHELRGFLFSVGFAILGGGAIVSVGLVYVQGLVGGIPFLDLIEPINRVATQAPSTFMLVFLGLGMFLGAVIVPRVAQRLSLAMLFVTGIAGFGLSMLGFASVTVYWVASLFGIGSGFFIAQVTVAGNTYVAETVADNVRGRIFAALESIIRVALLASMVLTAPIGDLVGGIVRRVVAPSAGAAFPLYFTGPRITLLFAAAIVIGAAFYALRAIDWRGERPNGEAGHA
jgi:dTMP kinase